MIPMTVTDCDPVLEGTEQDNDAEGGGLFKREEEKKRMPTTALYLDCLRRHSQGKREGDKPRGRGGEDDARKKLSSCSAPRFIINGIGRLPAAVPRQEGECAPRATGRVPLGSWPGNPIVCPVTQ